MINRKKKTILIDIDNTINMLSDYFIEQAIKLGYKIKDNIHDDYNLNNGLIPPDNCPIINIIDYVFCQEGFWINIPILVGAQNFITKILFYNGYKIVFLTTPYENSKTCKEEKKLWLKKYFNWITEDNIIFADKKWELESLGDMIIEDKPETIAKWHKWKFKFYHPYNNDIKADFTIYNWQVQSDEIYQKIKKVLG